MSLQILPNWCKKVGITIFFISFLFTGGDAFMDGFMSGLSGTSSNPHHFFKDLYGSTVMQILDILLIIGMLIYLFSKEKIEDDYVNLLRLESYQLTSMIFLFVALAIYIFDQNLMLSMEVFLSLFLIL